MWCAWAREKYKRKNTLIQLIEGRYHPRVFGIPLKYFHDVVPEDIVIEVTVVDIEGTPRGDRVTGLNKTNRVTN
jgi:hypothetical protein